VAKIFYKYYDVAQKKIFKCCKSRGQWLAKAADTDFRNVSIAPIPSTQQFPIEFSGCGAGISITNNWSNQRHRRLFLEEDMAETIYGLQMVHSACELIGRRRQ